MAGQGSTSYWAGFLAIGSCPSILSHWKKQQIRRCWSLRTNLGSGEGASTVVLQVTADECLASQAPRKGKETRHLVPVFLCGLTLFCLSLAFYELAADLTWLFRLICNHWELLEFVHSSRENYLKQKGWIALGRCPSPSADDSYQAHLYIRPIC